VLWWLTNPKKNSLDDFYKEYDIIGYTDENDQNTYLNVYGVKTPDDLKLDFGDFTFADADSMDDPTAERDKLIKAIKSKGYLGIFSSTKMRCVEPNYIRANKAGLETLKAWLTEYVDGNNQPWDKQ